MSHPPIDREPLDRQSIHRDRRGERSRETAPAIESVLQQLPRERASAAFTGEVLRRLEEPPPTRLRRGSRARGVLLGGLAVAASVVLGALLAPLLLVGDDPAARPPQRLAYGPEEVRELRAEYLELQRELQDLRRALTEAQPVVGLSGDDRVDYVVDLSDLLGAGSSSPIRPAAYPLRERR